MTFFQGTLQEGISTALQQAKSVVCFVTGQTISMDVILLPEKLTTTQITAMRATHGKMFILARKRCRSSDTMLTTSH
jgi:hypothetical protein